MGGSFKTKGDARKLVSNLYSTLDRLAYKTLSSGKALSYLEYLKGNYADEQTLVDPVFFPKFAEKILGFKIGSSIIPKKSVEASGEHPDFVPSDLHLHPFVFETKGTDSKDLTIHFPQVQNYIQKTGTEYGIILNLRELIVIPKDSNEPVVSLSLSFEKLYRDYETTPDTIDTQPDTKRFLNFVNKFCCQELDVAQKIQKIASAKPWTGDEVLLLEELTQKIREAVFVLHTDVRGQKHRLPQILGYDTKRKERIASEIDAIAESMEPGKAKRERSASSLNDMLQAKTGSLDEKAVDAYLYRVAYFTMTRILLVRLWEDIGFIKETLYDGGFEKWYEEFNRQIERVLRYAFHLAGERYSWLFNRENNYTWYYPRDKALVDVLYELSHFNLGKLNADVLGTIYEEYVDRVDRKNKGQYYTPREVVSFIWDRVGFNNDDVFFRFENGQRKPRLIFDPATGSGGFLVEAARRLREDATYNDHDIRDLLDIENAIITGLYGSEIQPFPYYITEINLLIQLTPIIKKILDSHEHLYHHPEFSLSVIHQDSLRLHNREQKTLPSEDFKKVDEVYEQDRRHDIVGLEGRKREIYEFIKDCRDFDYVCANPPYIREDDHKQLFRLTLRQYPYWKQYYQGKMDYLYFFVIIGLSKLREDGKLGFITTAYFPTAAGARKLRKYLLDNSRVLEVIDFGKLKLFEAAPGQFNHVFILQKCTNKEKRDGNRILTVKVKEPLPGKTNKEVLVNTLGYVQKYIGKTEFSDRHLAIHYSPVVQGELTDDYWTLFPTKDEFSIVQAMEQKGVPLSEICDCFQGLVTGADVVARENVRHLSAESIANFNIRIGDGIFYLTRQEMESLNLSKAERILIKPIHKAAGIESYLAEETGELDNLFVIYTTRDIDIEKYPRIKTHLDKFRPILENRLRVYEEHYPWYKLHRERDQKIFEEEKLVSSIWPERNSFGYSPHSYYLERNAFLTLKKPNTHENLKYILSILNSALSTFGLNKRLVTGEISIFCLKKFLKLSPSAV